MVIPAVIQGAGHGPAPLQEDVRSLLMREAQARQAYGPAWMLVFPETDQALAGLEKDPALLRRSAARDLGFLKLLGPRFESARLAFSLPSDTQWILLDWRGIAQANGHQGLKPEDLLVTLSREGWIPKEELRRVFMKDHPDQGEARSEALEECARLEFHRLGLRDEKASLPSPWNTPDQSLEEIAQALDALVAIPDWCSSSRPDFGLILMGEIRGGEPDPLPKSIEDAARRGLKDVEAQLMKEPGKFRLWRAWASLALWVPEASPVELLNSLQPTPSLAWPPAPHASILEVLRSRKDWLGLEQFASTGWRAFSPGIVPDEKAWETLRYSRIRIWGLPRFEGLLRLGRHAEAAAWVDTLHLEAGGSWPLVIPLINNAIHHLDPTFLTPPIQAVLDASPAPAPPIPISASKADPLIIILHGAPAGTMEAFRASESFDLFGPEELRWEISKSPGGPEPGWSIQRGQEILASGLLKDTDSKGLSSICFSLGTPKLAVLNRFLAISPDMVEIRQLRLDLLRQRMPNPRLEIVLLQDAVGLAAEVGFTERWKPDATMWGGKAAQVLARIELRLNRFPSEAKTWRAWMSWAQLRKNAPSLSHLVDSLSIWGHREDWVRGLPEEVALAMAGELEAQRRFPELEHWCQARMVPHPGGRPGAPLPGMAPGFAKFQKMFIAAREAQARPK